MTATATTRARQREQDALHRRAAAAALARRRRARRIVTTAVGTVVAIVATLVVVGIATNGSEAPLGPSARVSPAVLANLTDVPATTLDVVGSGTSNNPPQRVSGALRSSDGKPEVLYLGARTAAGLRTPSRSVMTTSTS